MNIMTKLALVCAIALAPSIARADFPLLTTDGVVPGCKIARALDNSKESLAAMRKAFANDPPLGMYAGYCAAWAAEAFDRYADQPGCFSNDISFDDLILVVIEYAAQHAGLGTRPFLSVAGGAIVNRWPSCVKR